MLTDPSGEIIETILIGALISVITNGIQNSINGEAFFKGWGRAAVIGAIGGAFSFGIGEAASGITGNLFSTGISNASAFQFVAHGALGGVMSEASGGKFVHGFLSGGIGSAVGGLGGRAFQNSGNFGRFVGTALTGGIAGGIGSSIAGGSFWDGFRNGAISAGLNHAAHVLQQVDPARLKARILKDGRLTLREANKWYRHGNGEALTVDAAKVDLDFVNLNDTNKYPVGKDRPVQTLGRSRDGLVYGGVTIENLGNNQLSIKSDFYNFEMHNGSGFGTAFRNFATKIGHFVAGQGATYEIKFSGVNTPNYRRNFPR